MKSEKKTFNFFLVLKWFALIHLFFQGNEKRKVHFRSKWFLFHYLIIFWQPNHTDIHIALLCSSGDGPFPR